MSDERLMDIREVAAYLNLAESTIYTWVQEGTLPAFRIGRRWRFRRTELDAWLEANRNVTDGNLLEGNDRGQRRGGDSDQEKPMGVG